MPRKHLSLQQRVEAARVLDTIDHLRSERGAKNESFAQEICKNLVAQGIIDCFWAIPRYSKLDYMGIDIVCQTPRGYYFLNVKSSMAGVNGFNDKKSLLLSQEELLPEIYPWRVVRQCGVAEAECRLVEILEGMPSCASLFPKVLEELACLAQNTVLANDRPGIENTIGKREQRMLIEEKGQAAKQAAKELRIKSEEEKRTVQRTLSLNNPWRSKFEMLEHKGICSIKRWDVVAWYIRRRRRVLWDAKIEVEIFGKVVRSTAGGDKKNKVEKTAANRVATQILDSLK